MPRLNSWLSSPEQLRYVLALQLLGCVGDDGSQGVPFLIQALYSTNRATRAIAAQSLAKLGPEARSAVPALVDVLDDPATRARAIQALGDIGPAAKEAVPRLEQLLDTSDRYRAAAAIHQIAPQGNGLRLLIEAAHDPQSRLAAVYWIGEIGPAAMPALDTLLEALRTETGTDRAGGPSWSSVASALRQICPTNRAVIPILLEKLRDAE
ncbi:MAG: HEAT repeat domain-containing protein, partial [Chloroflexi bacterium]|nr:HEAT repeat domain-containing protein [Chloroflexota bacterium]